MHVFAVPCPVCAREVVLQVHRAPGESNRPL